MENIKTMSVTLCMLVLITSAPLVSAVEFNTVVESKKSQVLEIIQNMDIEELKEIIKDNSISCDDMPLLLYILYILADIILCTIGFSIFIIMAILEYDPYGGWYRR